MAERKFRLRVRSSTTGKTRNRRPSDNEEYSRERARYAAVAIEAYRDTCGTDAEDTLSDMLTDLMHLCDRHSKYGNFEEEYDRARWSYEDEVAP